MADAIKRKRPAFNKDISEAISSHYRNVQTKKPLAYTLMSSNPLIELAYAAGIQPAFPENYACVCAARHASGDYCEKAEARNYSQDLCSYCRNHLGYIYAGGESPPMGGIGKPDLLLLTSSACTHYFKWWDSLHEIYGKPLIFVNTPRVMEMEAVPDFYMDYAVREIEEAIAEIERVVGTEITDEKLAQVVMLSDQIVEQWQKLMDLQKAVPCPLGLSDLTNALFLLIVLAGTEEGVALMKKVYNEADRRVAEGKGVLQKKEEKHRLLWMNIPFWYNLKILGYFEDRGCVFPVSDYTRYVWGTTRMDCKQPLVGLAHKALGGELNTSVDAHIDRLLEDVKAYRIDGVIAHSNRSCRVLSVGALDAVEMIRKKLKCLCILVLISTVRPIALINRIRTLS
jgi:benzoyl-CoA reductase/2-hydroxyglutaryl-CoA dehydratase subunit BcrC/BadD/HgdB